MLRVVVPLFAVSVLAGCAAVREAGPAAAPADAAPLSSSRDGARLAALTRARRAGEAPDGYRVGPDDLLAVRIPDLLHGGAEGTRPAARASGAVLPSVSEAPTYERGERVSGGGDIVLPYLGTIHVAGRTTEEIARDVADRLRRADLLRKPQVSVDVVEYRSGVVAVMGSVQRPGLYPVTRPGATLADQVWAAGGPDKDAGRVVSFTPTGGGDPMRVDLERLIQPAGEHDRDLNPPVRPGDVIGIAPAGSVLVDGWVEKPGAYPVTRGLTVAGAVAAAGGRHFAGDPSQVTVRRRMGPGAAESIHVDLVAVAEGRANDLSLADGDIVRMPVSYVRAVPWTVWGLAKEFVHIGGSILLF